MLGARVTGYALPPEYPRAPFRAARLDRVIRHTGGDIRSRASLDKVIRSARPDIVFHLAAQALVRESYARPADTFDTNVMGTANVLEAVRAAGRSCAVVVVTSDKCYENREWLRSYRETDPMGGHDPYSASKGCTELVVSSYRRSFFKEANGIALASARAGNVIGPGDWSRDRIVPDAISALLAGRPILVRNPQAVRPWQHVLEPLSGYLWLGAKLMSADAADFDEAWNFGPVSNSTRTVKDLADRVVEHWGHGRWVAVKQRKAPHEARLLRLNIDKAARRLAWKPVWKFEETIRRTVDGYRAMVAAGARPERVREFMKAEIGAYALDARARKLPWAKE
jgi:CDP-glucose 4,6-dehydratase